jgi:hypothetical protein
MGNRRACKRGTRAGKHLNRVGREREYSEEQQRPTAKGNRARLVLSLRFEARHRFHSVHDSFYRPSFLRLGGE